MSYKIRLMRQEDIEQVSEIEKEAFPTLPPANYYRELKGSLAHYIVVCDSEKQLPPVQEKNRCWPFSRKKRQPADYIIGFVGIWLMAGESHLVSIAVREDYRRHGLGEYLLIAIIEYSVKLKANLITLEVRASNTPAQSLYLKYGFVSTGRRRRYYSDNNEDAIIMTLNDPGSESCQHHLKALKEAHAKRWSIEGYLIEE